jgi:type IV secretory pathway TraG/TraD family ATPase VirD4
MMRYKLPPRITEPGLLVGYSLENHHIRTPVGFSFGSEEFSPSSGYLDPYLFQGEGHLMTIAPTGAGKGVSCVIPAALRHEGDLVVMDPKGENYAVTSAHRKSLGQEVYLLDPFGVTDDWTERAEADAHGLNVFELLPFLADDLETSAQAMAGMLAPGDPKSRQEFWDIAAQNILAGLITTYRDLGQGLDRMLEELRILPQRRNNVTYCDFCPDRCACPPEVEAFLVRANIESNSLLGAVKKALQLSRESIVLDSDGPNRDRELEQEIELMMTDDADRLEAMVVAELRFVERSTPKLKSDFLSHLARSIGAAAPCSAPSRIEVEAILSWATKILPAIVSAPRRSRDRVPTFFDDQETTTYPTAILKMFANTSSLGRAVSAQCAAAPNRTWGSMIATLESNLSYLQSRGVRAMLNGSGFDIERFREGTGTSVYIVFPPHRMASHSRLLAMLFKGLVNVICARKMRPPRNTLFLMDEVGQLGHMEEFLAAKTLLRGYGVQIWSFWQDLSQLRSCYPENWETIINNCKVFQAFGCATPLQAYAFDKLFELPASVLLGLGEDEMLLSVYGDEPVIARKPIYHSDPAFSELFRDNPLAPSAAAEHSRGVIDLGENRQLRPANITGRDFTHGKSTAAK